jgi:phytoene dehydrogenase-like protein
MDTFPSEKDNIVRFFAYFSGLRENAASVSPFDAVKLKGKSFDSFLRAFFTDDALMNAIACPVFGYVGLPPSLMQAATGIKIFHDYVLDGGYYPRGGMQELSNAFASVIERNNGTLLYRKRVTRILCNNNIAEGVELDNHDVYRSKNVVSACDITQTFKTFLGCDVVAEKVMHKLDDFVPSVSTFILYLGLSGPFDGLPNPGTNIWHLPAPDLEKVYEQIMHGDIGNSFGGHVFRVSPDRKTILVFCLTPYKTSQYWKLRKKDIARDLLAKIGALIPDLKNHVVYCDAASPETLFRFTRNHQGANYGWAPLPSQSFDPDFRQKTSVQGLYVTGHWTTQTHGIPSVAALGRHAANLILRRGWRNPA